MPDELIQPRHETLLERGAAQMSVPDLWEGTGVIQEIGARGALVGIPLADLQRIFVARFLAAKRTLDSQLRFFQRTASGQGETLARESAECDAARRAAKEAFSTQYATVPGLRTARRIAGASVQNVLRRIQARRLSSWFEAQDATDAHRHARESRALDQRRILGEARAKTASEDRKQNAQANEQAQKALQAELVVVSAEHASVRDTVGKIQQRGLTRPVARFLTWAGFFSLAGIGSLVASALMNRVPGLAGNQFSPVSLQHLFGIDDGRRPLWQVVGTWVGVLVLMLSLLWISAFLTFKVLGRLDKSGTGRRRGSGSAGDHFGNWLSLLQLASPGISKSVGALDHRFLLQLIAAIPILLGIGLFGFFWLTTAPVQGISASPSPSFQVIYIGTVYVLLATSTALLFWLFVLRPAIDNEPVRRLPQFFYSVLLLLPHVALLVNAIAPREESAFPLAVIAVSLVGTAGGLGHGIFLKGIFSREEYLERARGRLRTALDQLQKEPTAEDFAWDFGKGNQIERILANEARAGDPTAPHRSVPVWKKLARETGRVAQWLRRSRQRAAPTQPAQSLEDEMRVLAEEGLVPAELIVEFNESSFSYSEARAKLTSAEQECARLENIALRNGQRQAEIETRLGVIHRQQMDAMGAHQAAMLQLITGHQRVQVALAEAYRLALLVIRSQPSATPVLPDQSEASLRDFIEQVVPAGVRTITESPSMGDPPHDDVDLSHQSGEAESPAQSGPSNS